MRCEINNIYPDQMDGTERLDWDFYIFIWFLGGYLDHYFFFLKCRFFLTANFSPLHIHDLTYSYCSWQKVKSISCTSTVYLA